LGKKYILKHYLPGHDKGLSRLKALFMFPELTYINLEGLVFMNQDKKFYLSKEVRNTEIIVYLNGELDLSVVAEMREELEPYVNQTGRALTLNLENLNYIDSTGIGIIITMLKTRDSLGVPFQVVEVPAKIQRLFDITGISKYLVADTDQSPMERNEDIV
jgi:anti-sigma B factor antagonist